MITISFPIENKLENTNIINNSFNGCSSSLCFGG